MTTEPTVYGTSSLASDERLSARATRRRAVIKWSLVGLGVCAVCAVLAVFGLTALPEDAAVAPVKTAESTPNSEAAPALDTEVVCVQSSGRGH
ncbi:hypothetical protein PC123_g22075 [Phytophthora cactorum]|nr:hypothetical protein PC123_g22075 [Phytophthora cactorum]